MTEMKSMKVCFELEKDENGYPPDKWETLWTNEIAPGLYSVDNIPFYVYGISSEDVVSAEEDDEQLVFKKLVRPSSNTVFRLYVSDVAEMQTIRDEFWTLGCESELSNLPKLLAVEVPGNVNFGPVAAILEKGEGTGRWEYDEGVFRHQITG